MRVLFSMHVLSGYYRQFEPTIREMLRRGHHVHIVADRADRMRSREWLEELRADHPGVTWGRFPLRVEVDPWEQARRHLRLTRDYLRYLGPDFAQTPYLTLRARRRMPPGARSLLSRPRFPLRGPRAARALHDTIAAIERHIPPRPAVHEYMREQRPDVLVLTPHLMPGSLHQDHVHVARSLGIPTVLAIASWDNLSSKGLITCRPDTTLVWNEIQKREAIEMHGLPADRIEITGAQVYDEWFESAPRPREEFCARVGLPADRPFVLYLGSSLFPGKRTETQFALDWLRALREHPDEDLRQAGVMFRTHPNRLTEWQAVDFSAHGPVTLWPREGRMPVAREAKQDFFDSLYHCGAVFAINTSAMIEAGVTGNRVHGLILPEFFESQQGTLHFKYLTEAGGGLLRIAVTLEKHLDDLAATLAGQGDPVAENRPFLEAFVRPKGVDVPSTPLFVDAVERAAAGRDEVAPLPASVRAAHILGKGAGRAGLAAMPPTRRRSLKRRSERRAASFAVDAGAWSSGGAGDPGINGGVGTDEPVTRASESVVRAAESALGAAEIGSQRALPVPPRA